MGRRLKQLVYGTFYLLFFGVVLFGFYLVFLKPAPNCFDKTKNQSEESVDCGGPCKNLCFPEGFGAIEVVGQVRIFHPSPNHVSLFAEIKNPNSDFAGRKFYYTFTLYDKNGAIVENINGDSFIYGGERSYLLAPNLILSSSLAKGVDLNIENPDWVKSEDFAKPKIFVKTKATILTGDSIRVSGTIANEDSADFSSAKIIVIFYGRFNKPIGASETEINNLASNQTYAFNITHPFLEDVNIDTTQVFIAASPLGR